MARAIALYLPQFHPIPENDAWWGKGFTEWTNTAKARPLFPGHEQPHIPADLGFYDLRLPEARAAQAALARAHGIEGFCYYHYWFGGRRVLERPFQEVLTSGEPDFPFCLCWANETWSGVWHGSPRRTLIEQTYPGDDDHRAHFAALLPAFRDPRHITVEGRPLFLVYRPRDLPDPPRSLALWRAMAERAGLPGLHIVGCSNAPGDDLRPLGYDATLRGPDIVRRPWRKDWRDPVARVWQSLRWRLGLPHIFEFASLAEAFRPRPEAGVYPAVVHAWDNTPRSGREGVVYRNPSPALYEDLLRAAVEAVAANPPEQRLVFLKSWNEWAEGNHLEPDLRDGTAYLEVVARVMGGAGTPSRRRSLAAAEAQ